MRIKTILIIISIALSLTSCMSYDFSRRVVKQGNLLPQRKLEQLKPGMSKNDVAVLMGTSLMSPVFNNDRWDYAFTWRKGSSATSVKHLTLYFKNDKLVRFEHQP
jgi:outer membrane protein assembly factor BamE